MPQASKLILPRVAPCPTLGVALPRDRVASRRRAPVGGRNNGRFRVAAVYV